MNTFGFEAPKRQKNSNVLTTLEQPKKVLVVTENEDVKMLNYQHVTFLVFKLQLLKD